MNDVETYGLTEVQFEQVQFYLNQLYTDETWATLESLISFDVQKELDSALAELLRNGEEITIPHGISWSELRELTFSYMKKYFKNAE